MLDEFLICENPILDDSDERLFALHTGSPKILAEIIHFETNDEEAQMECKKQFSVYTTLEYEDEYIVFGALWIEKNELSENKLAQLMNRMSEWYEKYLTWEDSQELEP